MKHRRRFHMRRTVWTHTRAQAAKPIGCALGGSGGSWLCGGRGANLPTISHINSIKRGFGKRARYSSNAAQSARGRQCKSAAREHNMVRYKRTCWCHSGSLPASSRPPPCRVMACCQRSFHVPVNLQSFHPLIPLPFHLPINVHHHNVLAGCPLLPPSGFGCHCSAVWIPTFPG